MFDLYTVCLSGFVHLYIVSTKHIMKIWLFWTYSTDGPDEHEEEVGRQAG